MLERLARNTLAVGGPPCQDSANHAAVAVVLVDKRSLFADVMATCGGDGTCYVKNDRAGLAFHGMVTLETLAFADGAVAVVHTEQVSLGVGAGAIKYFHAGSLTKISGTTHMLVATVRDVDGGDAVLSTNEIPLAAPMAMVLPPAAVAARLAEAANLDGAFRLLPSELV